VSLAFQLQPGAQPFPGFTLHLPLGRGSSGQVWEARGPDGSAVALKFVNCKNSTLAAKEVRSFQALGGLYHPNLLRVHQVFLHAEFVVISMELAEGSLMDLLEVYAADHGTAVKPEFACDYLSQAAQAVDYLNCHRHDHEGRRVGFQHCDIKPSNILVFRDCVKLADFGLASPMTTSVTPHDRVGTLDFAAPEVYCGKISDRTDQYALAVTYCLLRGGRLPFHNKLGRFTPTYARGNPDLTMLSPPERPIVAQALAISPINRWPSCSEFMARLQELIKSERQTPATVACSPR
jgi:serine/threonine-protein kinase